MGEVGVGVTVTYSDLSSSNSTAQATASAERIAPGRLRFLISIGDRPHDERFGLRRPSARACSGSTRC